MKLERSCLRVRPQETLYCKEQQSKPRTERGSSQRCSTASQSKCPGSSLITSASVNQPDYRKQSVLITTQKSARSNFKGRALSLTLSNIEQESQLNQIRLRKFRLFSRLENARDSFANSASDFVRKCARSLCHLLGRHQQISVFTHQRHAVIERHILNVRDINQSQVH